VAVDSLHALLGSDEAVRRLRDYRRYRLRLKELRVSTDPGKAKEHLYAHVLRATSGAFDGHDPCESASARHST
jgi:hypothetical protein